MFLNVDVEINVNVNYKLNTIHFTVAVYIHTQYYHPYNQTLLLDICIRITLSKFGDEAVLFGKTNLFYCSSWNISNRSKRRHNIRKLGTVGGNSNFKLNFRVCKPSAFCD